MLSEFFKISHLDILKNFFPFFPFLFLFFLLFYSFEVQSTHSLGTDGLKN